MATVVENEGKKFMLDESIVADTTLRFEATYSVSGGADQTLTATTTYSTATIDTGADTASTDITADIKFDFPDDETVISQVALQYNDLIYQDIITEATSIPLADGGSLIIKEFKITIS